MGHRLPHNTSAADRISEFEMKLMDIDGEHLSIPDTEYASTIEMPASEFQRIVRDLSILGDSCRLLPPCCRLNLPQLRRHNRLHEGRCHFFVNRRSRLWENCAKAKAVHGQGTAQLYDQRFGALTTTRAKLMFPSTLTTLSS